MSAEKITIPTIQNDVIIYPYGHLPSTPADMPELPRNVVSLFGFKVMKFAMPGGQEMKVWAAATEEDYREAEAQRLGIKPEEVHLGSCGYWCNNQCGYYWCYGAGLRSGTYYYCTCW